LPKFYICFIIDKKFYLHLFTIQKLSSQIETLNKRILHQTENIPQELIQSYQNANKQARAQTMSSNKLKSSVNSSRIMSRIEQKTPGSTYKNMEKQEIIKDCKRMLFNEPEICHTISFITVEEFNKVPKYIIGRQTLDTINSLINTINQTLVAKYTILALGKTTAQKKGDLDLYLRYKKQELDVQEKDSKYLNFY